MLVWLLFCGSIMIEAMAVPSSAREPRPHSTVSPSAVRVANNNVETPAPPNRAAAVSSTGEAAQSEPIPAQESKPQGFRVDQYVVDGNTILSAEQIGLVLDKYKRSGLTFKEIEQARTELEKVYHAAGYPTVLVTIPEQTVDRGTVQLNVFEGRLGAIAVEGNEHFTKYNILGKMPSVKHGALLYEPTFVKELNAANGNPDLKIVPVLKPGAEPGLVNLELKVKDRLPVHARVEADNKGPITTPRNRLIAEVQHANLFGRDEILTVSTVQTPEEWGQVQNYGASFVLPIVWPNHLLSVYASKAQSTSVLAGGSLSVGGGNVTFAGNATVAGIRYMFPLAEGGWGTHQLSIGADYKRLERTTGTFPEPLGTLTLLSPIQYTPVSLAYTGFLPDRFGLTRVTASARGYVAGMIPGGRKKDFVGDPNDFNEPGQARVGSTGTFAVLQGGIDRVQELPEGFALTLHVDGQWGSQPLIPAEQYFAGGMDTVRGYNNFEVIADHALRGRAELTTPELFALPIDRIWQRRRSADYTIRLRLVTFYDAAQLWVEEPQPGQIPSFRLEGIGAGIRVKFPKDIGELKVDQGWAMNDTPATQRGDTYVHFSVGIGF
ncbi:MAG TPA: ShlB/FhaC/HecB family hemolysin secretion/activation protein [Nitrospiraceae bacterium]|nr:ShlB/FhaC/HecB family hemolysin secretion/activation protein [Nitrospiraceae bacterium]